MFQEVDIKTMNFNPFTKFSKEWMLITAGNETKCNTMTASWGGLGVLWDKCVSFVFIRPGRYTLKFVQNNDYYSLCFLSDSNRKILNYCGSHSGRDGNKIEAAGLTPVFNESAPYFEEAELVLICRKMHEQQVDPGCFIDPEIDREHYPQKDYHEMFIGDIVKVLQK